MGRAIRRTLIRFVRLLVVRPVVGLLALVAIVVVAGAGVFAFSNLTAGSGPGIALRMPMPRSGEPEATEEFLRGNRDYNAELIWKSFSDDAKAQLQNNGGSLQTLEQQMQSAKQRGVAFEEISYIGGKDLQDGTSKEFYLVGIRPQAKGEIEYVPFMFTLDRDGKIARVQ